MHTYEAAMLGVYARNLISQCLKGARGRRSSGGGPLQILAWLASYERQLKVDDAVFLAATRGHTDFAKRHKSGSMARGVYDLVKSTEDSFDFTSDTETFEPAIKPAHARRALRTWVSQPASALPVVKSSLQKRLDAVTSVLGLDEASTKVIGFLMRFNTNKPLYELVHGVVDGDWDDDFDVTTRSDIKWIEIGGIIGVSASALLKVKASNSALRRLGLVSDCQRDCELEDPILQLAQQGGGSTKVSVITTLMGRKCRPSEAMTTWSDFAHLGKTRDVALNLLKGALEAQAKGVVILLYGPPGTGKTAFAQTLIAQAGAKGWMVGEADADGDEANRRGRLSSLLLASALSKNSKDAVLVLDEADDVFNDGSASLMSMFLQSKARDGSKIFMNRALEDLAAPTILIVNDANNLGEAIIRRMSLAIEIKTPSAEQSAKIAARVLARQKLKASPETLRALAEGGTPPAVMALAARCAKLSGGGSNDLTLAARSVTRMLRIKQKPLASDLAGLGFDPAFANADIDLARLADQAVACGNRALSFCLYGLPGTGKSAFARWIAGRMGMEVIEKRGSDLFGMYVGETEQNIARAFEEAADREAFLIFDEADSLLADRTGAHRSWEVSQVNEMLTWMERHPMPFACTTNLMKGLDPAALRRFLFKAEFKPMTPDQGCALFARTFGIEAPNALRHLDLLTPGDFAVVARKACVLGANSPSYLLEALQGEVALKAGGGRVKVGF